jgi:hypothetical protein
MPLRLVSAILPPVVRGKNCLEKIEGLNDISCLKKKILPGYYSIMIWRTGLVTKKQGEC